MQEKEKEKLSEEKKKDKLYYIKLSLDKKLNINLGLSRQKAKIFYRKRLVSIAIKAAKRLIGGRRLSPSELAEVITTTDRFIKI